MGQNRPTYDVFLLFDHRHRGDAAEVVDVLHSYDLTVFADIDQVLAGGAQIEDVIWEAMAESHALVAILPEDVSTSWMAFELGAAKAWNKPTYVVATSPSLRSIPVALRHAQILPKSRVDEVAKSILASSAPISNEELEMLGAAYAKTGISVDQLVTQPQQLAKLVDEFNGKTGRSISGEQVMSILLRLRKKRALPPLGKRKPRRD